jgi:AAA family ATP:ADP antiporter
MSRLGVTAAILMAPPVMAVSFAVQALYPGLAASTALQVFRRAVAFGVVTPALHVLFTVVDREQKYKAKAFIDTVVYRGGDVLGSSAVKALFDAGVAAPGVALAAVPIGAVWLAVAIFIGKRHQRLAQGGAGGDLR